MEGTHRAASLRPAKKEREQTWVRERVTNQWDGHGQHQPGSEVGQRPKGNTAGAFSESASLKRLRRKRRRRREQHAG